MNLIAWYSSLSPLSQLIAVIGCSIAASAIITTIIKYMVRKIAVFRGINPKDLRMAKTEMFLMTLIILIGAIVGIEHYPFDEQASLVMLRILKTLLVFNIGAVVTGVIRVFIELFIHPYVAKTESKVDDQIVRLAHRTSTIIISILTLLYALTVWGVQIGPLVASLGIAGLAVALALQPTLGNIFSGITLFLDNTFTVGDLVKVGDTTGTVYDLGLRTTKIRTFDNEIVIIPNSALANEKIININKPDRTVRVNIEFGVEYGTDPEYVKMIVIEELNAVRLRDPEQDVRVMFTSMGESALQFKAMFWVADLEHRWPAHQEGITRLYRRLYKEGIGIPFPQRTVWLREEGRVRAPTPDARKFDAVKGKYFAHFGREYQEPAAVQPQSEDKDRSSKSILGKVKTKAGAVKRLFRKDNNSPLG